MKFSTNIVINRPVTKVFNFAMHPHNLKTWVNTLKGYKTLKGRRNQVGNTGVLIFEDKEGKLEVSEEIVQFERNRFLHTKLSHKGMDSEIQIKFLDQGDSTKVMVNTTVRLKPWIANLFSIFMKNEMKQQQARDYQRFKKSN